MRRTKFIATFTGVVLVAAVVIALAARGIGHKTPSAGPSAGTTATTAQSGRDGSKGDGSKQGHKGQLTAVSPAIGLRPGAVSPNAAGLATAQALLPKLTPLQLAGQRVIYSYSGVNPPAQLLWLIRHGEAAGVIFFGANVGATPPTAADLAHFKSVVKELEAADDASTNPVHLPLLLMTDQEGGIVRRLPGPPILSEKQVGESANPTAAASTAGRGAARNLRSYGLNVNLAPVLDVFRKPGNFIDQFGRSYSSNPHVAAALGTAFIKAQQAGGVAATAKHFPGLGAAATNQDTDMRPVTLNLTLNQIRTIDELPYQSAIPAGVKLVMVSWARYPALDKKYPAGLSTTIVGGELRDRLGFGGVTITDALEAGALKAFGTIANRSTLAARAGMDLLLCAAGNPSEGDQADHSLAYDFQHHLLNASTFKAAAERVIALRKTLPS